MKIALPNRRKSIRKNGEAVETDMTPMIDVVFLLIIFFLCIDFKVLEAKLPTYLPKDKGGRNTYVEPQDDLRLKIVCDAVGQPVWRPGRTTHRLVGHVVHYQLETTKCRDLDALRTALQEIRTSRPDDIPVVVEPGPGVVYGDVARAVDTVAAVGFAKIHFGGSQGRK